MIIIGIDTALRKTGYGVIDMKSGSSLEVLDCGVIANTAKMPHSECLRRLSGGIRELVEKYHPQVASIESAFVNRNIKTAMILSLARGAVIARLAELAIPVYEYSPKSAKRAATGRGEATKEQVALVISALGKIQVSDIPNDATDALALALCHGALYQRSKNGLFLPTPL